MLQGHLARVFDEDGDHIVAYLVPTRALIAQDSRDLSDIFAGTTAAHEIVTVPLDADQQIQRRSILVMTQERVQLMLMSHPDLRADVMIVDEAHSIRFQREIGGFWRSQFRTEMAHQRPAWSATWVTLVMWDVRV